MKLRERVATRGFRLKKLDFRLAKLASRFATRCSRFMERAFRFYGQSDCFGSRKKRCAGRIRRPVKRRFRLSTRCFSLA